ncbi:hypothetical protein Lser_V15G03635 [Lactuca serriola]
MYHNYKFRVISISSRTVAPLKSRSRNSVVNHHQHSTSLFVPEVGLDDSLEDERDLDMADRRATEIELDTMEGFASREKLHHHLNDQADLIQESDSKLPVVQLALELTHKIFGSCPPMQSFDPAKMLTCKVTSTSVPPSSWTPRSQREILQLGNLKPFSFNVLKLATRNFRLDNVLGEGGFGSVFKGWIDEQSVKRLNQAIFKLFRDVKSSPPGDTILNFGSKTSNFFQYKSESGGLCYYIQIVLLNKQDVCLKERETFGKIYGSSKQADHAVLTQAFGKFYGNSKQGTNNDKSHGGVHENCIKFHFKFWFEDK